MLTFGIRFEQKQLEAWAGIDFKRNCKEDKNNCAVGWLSSKGDVLPTKEVDVI